MNASIALKPTTSQAALPDSVQVWLVLFWKEWCEHRWKLASLVVIDLALLFCTAPGNLRAWADGAVVVLYFIGVAGAFFVALGSAAAERSRGTLPFVTATPLSLRKLAAMKLLAGALTAIIPPLVGLGAMALFDMASQWLDPSFHVRLPSSRIPFGFQDFYLGYSVGLVTICLSAYLWTAALGVNAASEIRAAMFALLFLVAWMMLLVWFDSSPGREIGASLPRFYTDLRAVGPLGLMLFDWSPWTNRLWIPIALAVASHAALAARYILVFGRASRSRGAESRPALPTNDWLGPPRATPLTAIAWKQWREAGPVAFAAFGGALILALFLSFSHIQLEGGSWNDRHDLWMAGQAVFGMLMFFGMIATVVIGVGVLHGEVQPGIETFWRSRPIRPSLWFWTKYLTGLGIIAAAFGLPLCLLGLWLESVHTNGFDDEFLSVLIAIGAGAAGYSMAVAWMAVTRHTVYASILAFGSALSCVITIDPGYIAPSLGAFWITVLAIAATLIAWLFVAKDWGWRGE